MERHELDARFRMILAVWASLLGGVTLFTGIVVALTTGAVGTWEPSLAPSTGAPLLLIAVLPLGTGIAFRRGEIPRAGEPAARLTAWQNRVILASALQEGGGLMALVVSLLSGQPTWALGAWAVTILVMGLARPAREELDALMR